MRRTICVLVIIIGLILLAGGPGRLFWWFVRLLVGNRLANLPSAPEMKPYSLQVEAPQVTQVSQDDEVSRVSTRIDDPERLSNFHVPDIAPSNKTIGAPVTISRAAVKDSLSNWMEESLEYSAIAAYTVHYSTPSVSKAEEGYDVQIAVSHIDIGEVSFNGELPQKLPHFKSLGGFPDEIARELARPILMAQACSRVFGAEGVGEIEVAVRGALGDESQRLASIGVSPTLPQSCNVGLADGDIGQAKAGVEAIASTLESLEAEREVSVAVEFEDPGLVSPDVRLAANGIAKATFPIQSDSGGLYIEAVTLASGQLSYFVEAPESKTEVSIIGGSDHEAWGETEGAPEFTVGGRLSFAANKNDLRERALRMADVQMQKQACRAGLPGDLNVAAATAFRMLEINVTFFPFSPACDTYG